MPNCKLWLNEQGELVMEDGKIAFSEDCPCDGHGGTACLSDLLRFVARKASRIACPTVPEAGFPLVEMDLESIIVSVCGYEITVPNNLNPPTCGDGYESDDCSCLVITKMICPWMGNAETDPPEELVPHLYPVIQAPDYPSIFPTELDKCLQINWRSCFNPYPIGYVYAAVQVIAPRCWFDDGDANDKTLVWGVVGCFCEMGESGSPYADWQYRKFCGGANGPGAIVVDAAFLPKYITVPNEDGENATHQEMVCDITCKGSQQLIQEMVNHYGSHGQVTGIYISVDPDEWEELTGEEVDRTEECFFKFLKIGCGWTICCEQLDKDGYFSTRTKAYIFDCDCNFHLLDETNYWDSQLKCFSSKGSKEDKRDSSPVYLYHKPYVPSNSKASTDYPGEQDKEVECLENVDFPNFCEGTCPDLDLLQAICAHVNGINGYTFTGSPTVQSLLWYNPATNQSTSTCPVGASCIPHASNAGTGGVIATQDPRDSNIYQFGCAESEKCLFACWNDTLGLLLWIDCTCTLRKACTLTTKKKFFSSPSSCLCTDWRLIAEENKSSFGITDSAWGSDSDVEMSWEVNGQSQGFRGCYWTFRGDEIPFDQSCNECAEDAVHITGVDVWHPFIDYEMFIIRRAVGGDVELGHLEKDGSFINLRIEASGGRGCLVGSNSRLTGWIPFRGACDCDLDPNDKSGYFGCGAYEEHLGINICNSGGGYNGWFLIGSSYNCYAIHGTSIVWCHCTSYPEYDPSEDDYLCEYKNRTLSPDWISFEADYWLCLRPNFASKRFKIPGHEEDAKCNPNYYTCHWEPPKGGISAFSLQFVETSCGLYLCGSPTITFLEGVTIPGTSTLSVSLGNQISSHFGYYDPLNVTNWHNNWPSNDLVVSGTYIDDSQSVVVGPDNILFRYVRIGPGKQNIQPPPCRGASHCPAGATRLSSYAAYCSYMNQYACAEDWTDPDDPTPVAV